jgi:protoheme IX farnesyltransferase
MYRADYAKGGLKMLPGSDPSGRWTAGAAIVTSLALIAVSLLPITAGLAGWVYGGGAIACGLFFTWRAVQFGLDRTDRRAKSLLRASLLYLPAVLGLLLVARLLPVGL